MHKTRIFGLNSGSKDALIHSSYFVLVGND